jgi:hypothetical protein
VPEVGLRALPARQPQGTRLAQCPNLGVWPRHLHSRNCLPGRARRSPGRTPFGGRTSGTTASCGTSTTTAPTSSRWGFFSVFAACMAVVLLDGGGGMGCEGAVRGCWLGQPGRGMGREQIEAGSCAEVLRSNLSLLRSLSAYTYKYPTARRPQDSGAACAWPRD